ncbi:MAG: GspH/FimT family pseudopilin [Woeseiaceae bacterium]
MRTRHQIGFTLYELLITMLVIGVILAIGVPNLGDFTRNSRITGAANDLHGSFMVARSEAARAKQNITICASAAPMGAALCDGASFDDGWIIFVDLNGDIERAGTDENVLKAFPPLDGGVHVNSDGATYFGFAPTGLGRGDIAGKGAAFQTAMICDERGNVVASGGNSAARRLVVTPLGRSVVMSDQQTIAASNDAC